MTIQEKTKQATTKYRWFGATLAACSLLVVPASLLAETFRIQTTIYVEGEEEPLGSNLTLFDTAAVYDYSLEGELDPLWSGRRSLSFL